MNKIVESLDETRRKINSIDFDAHWYRRVFHTFGASFLIFYVIPNDGWIGTIKIWIPILFVALALSLEVLRLNGVISSEHFFGLRFYEKSRIGSYLFFGIGALILLLLFPQQIAVPCILCASIGDPIMGETRLRRGRKSSIVVGFLVCMSFFIVTWHQNVMWVALLISILGGGFAVLGEIKKYWWIDDDFMVQMLPAITLFLIIIFLRYMDIDIVFKQIIFPG
ncbi:MAG: dolichol kinase [Candidatus Thermoplasmatota archaeon]